MGVILEYFVFFWNLFRTLQDIPLKIKFLFWQQEKNIIKSMEKH